MLGAPEVSWIDRQLSELLGCVCAVAKSGSAEGRRVLDEMPERLATLTARFAARELKAGESVAPLAVLAEVQRELEEAIRSAQR